MTTNMLTNEDFKVLDESLTNAAQDQFFEIKYYEDHLHSAIVGDIEHYKRFIQRHSNKYRAFQLLRRKLWRLQHDLIVDGTNPAPKD